MTSKLERHDQPNSVEIIRAHNVQALQSAWNELSTRIHNLADLSIEDTGLRGIPISRGIPVSVLVNGDQRQMHFYYYRQIVSHDFDIYHLQLCSEDETPWDKSILSCEFYWTIEPAKIDVYTTELYTQSEARGNGLGRALMFLNNRAIEKVIDLTQELPQYRGKPIVATIEDDATTGEHPQVRTKWTTFIATQIGYVPSGGKLLKKRFR